MINTPKRPPVSITSNLRQRYVTIPEAIRKTNGIQIYGKRIRSLIFTTDLAIVMNNNADGIIAVYPFTPQISINNAIIDVSSSPVFCGVGGGVTSGERSISIALQAELHGAYGVVLNSPAPNELIHQMNEVLDLPIVVTVVSEYENVRARVEAGARIVNVSGGKDTSHIVKKIRTQFPDLPIIATGGPSDESILKTIEAGANAITFTPPPAGDLFSDIMENYRQKQKEGVK